MESPASISSEESFWNGQKDSLRKIREVLDQSAQNRSSPISNVYRRPRPAFLPEFRQQSANSSTLKGSRYNIVPPLRFKSADSRHDGYDSWGDDIRDSESEMEDDLLFYPHSFAGRPVFTRVSSGQKKPPKKPLKGVLQHNYDRNLADKPLRRVTYRSSPVYLMGNSDKALQPRNGKLPVVNYSEANPFDPTSNQIIAKYLPMSKSRYYANAKSQEDPFDYLVEHPLFANQFVDQLMEDFLEEEIVPDFLIEFYRESESRLTPELKYIQSYEPKKMTSFSRYKRDNDHLKQFLNTLVNEVINEECHTVARLAGRERPGSWMQQMAINDIIMEMTTEEILQTGNFIVDEALLEMTVEDIVDAMIFRPEIAEQSKEVAVETLQQYSSKLRQREIQQIEKSVGQRLQEEVCFDYLMKLLTRQGQLFTKEEYANKILDDVVLSLLLSQNHDVKRRRRATIENVPLRKIHEKMMTDVALEVLLDELNKHLEEDMTDLDLYEQGMLQNVHQWLASEEALHA